MIKRILALAIITTATAAAQDVQVSSPYWNDRGTTFPTKLVEKVPDAVADATRAKWTYRDAETTLNRAVIDRVREFELSDKYIQARNELRDAFAAFEQAKLAAARPLLSDSRYLAAKDLVRRLSEQIKDEHLADEPDARRIEALAKLKLEYATQFRDTESALIDADAEVRAARKRLLDANDAIARLRSEFEQKMRSDLDLAELRQTKREARIVALTAAAYRDATLEVARVAIDFARWDSRNQRYATGGWVYPYYDGYGRRVVYPIGYSIIR